LPETTSELLKIPRDLSRASSILALGTIRTGRAEMHGLFCFM